MRTSYKAVLLCFYFKTTEESGQTCHIICQNWCLLLSSGIVFRMFGFLARILINKPFKDVYKIPQDPETVNLTSVLCGTVSQCIFVVTYCRSTQSNAMPQMNVDKQPSKKLVRYRRRDCYLSLFRKMVYNSWFPATMEPKKIFSEVF
jgi:hypothetical protein